MNASGILRLNYVYINTNNIDIYILMSNKFIVITYINYLKILCILF